MTSLSVSQSLAQATLTADQQRFFWFLQQMSPDTPAINIVATMQTSLLLHESDVREAVAAVVARHMILRSLLVQRDGDLVQAVLPVDAVGLTHLSAVDPDAARADAFERAWDVIDLEREAPSRWFLYSCGSQGSVVACVCHHAAVDGSSMDVVFADVVAALEQRLPAEEGRQQYSDYARWQRSSGVINDNVRWWADQLEDFPFEADDSAFAPASVERAGADELLAASRAAGARAGVLPAAALAAGLTRAWGEPHRPLLLGIVVANRVRPEFSGVVGPLARMIPLPVRLIDGDTIEQDCSRLHQQLASALARQDVPLDRVADELRRRRVAFTFPSVVLNLISRDAIATSLRGSPIRMDMEEVSEDGTYADLVVALARRGGWLIEVTVRRGSRYEGLTAHDLMDAWRRQYEPPPS